MFEGKTFLINFFLLRNILNVRLKSYMFLIIIPLIEEPVRKTKIFKKFNMQLDELTLNSKIKTIGVMRSQIRINLTFSFCLFQCASLKNPKS